MRGGDRRRERVGMGNGGGVSQMTRTAVISQPFLFGVQMCCTEVVGFVVFFFPTQKNYLPCSVWFHVKEVFTNPHWWGGEERKERVGAREARDVSSNYSPPISPTLTCGPLRGWTRTVAVLEIPECRSPTEWVMPQVERRVECGCRWEVPMPPTYLSYQPDCSSTPHHLFI